MDNTISDEQPMNHPLDPPKPRKFAGFWMRFWAYLIDLLVIGSIYRIMINPTFRWLDLPLNDPSIFSIKAVSTGIIFFAYFLLMTKFFGQTLGKMVFAIKVVSKELDRQLTWSTLFFREVIGRFISKKILLIGYLISGFTSEKKALHDIFADTRVIHTKK